LGHEKINLLAFKDQNIITGLEYYDKMRWIKKILWQDEMNREKKLRLKCCWIKFLIGLINLFNDLIEKKLS
jgi:hypothetical protein